MYKVWRLLGRDIVFYFLSEVPATNWAAQHSMYQPKG